MVRFITIVFAAIGMVLVTLALFGYVGLRQMATAPATFTLNDNFLLRFLTGEYVKNSPPNIDIAVLHKWLWNRVMAIGAAGALIVATSVYVLVRRSPDSTEESEG